MRGYAPDWQNETAAVDSFVQSKRPFPAVIERYVESAPRAHQNNLSLNIQQLFYGVSRHRGKKLY
jgi:hypothetical protein